MGRIGPMELTALRNQMFPTGTWLDEFVVERVLGRGYSLINYFAEIAGPDRGGGETDSHPAMECGRSETGALAKGSLDAHTLPDTGLFEGRFFIDKCVCYPSLHPIIVSAQPEIRS